MYKFKEILQIIGINPFVFVPRQILNSIFEEAKKDKGAIPVCGTVNKNQYTQTLVKYKGEWRLYINTKMLPNSPKKIGDALEITIQYDPNDRTIKPHSLLLKALEENQEAKKIFETLSPSMQNEIIRYISFLKTETSVINNVEKAIGFLLGKNRFVGREKP